MIDIYMMLRNTLLPRLAAWRAAAACSTGPPLGYNDPPEEMNITVETNEQHAQDRANAEKLVEDEEYAQDKANAERQELGEALAADPREAAPVRLVQSYVCLRLVRYHRPCCTLSTIVAKHLAGAPGGRGGPIAGGETDTRPKTNVDTSGTRQPRMREQALVLVAAVHACK
jgi:hypothetical protein